MAIHQQAQDSNKEISMKPQKQTPLPFLTMDCIKGKLCNAHTVLDQCGEEMQSYTNSLGKFYDHWADQLQQELQGRIFNFQFAYSTLQDQFEKALATNAILQHELGIARHDVELYREQLQQHQNVAVEKKHNAVVEYPDENASENSSTISPNGYQEKKRRRKRNEPNER